MIESLPKLNFWCGSLTNNEFTVTRKHYAAFTDDGSSEWACTNGGHYSPFNEKISRRQVSHSKLGGQLLRIQPAVDRS